MAEYRIVMSANEKKERYGRRSAVLVPIHSIVSKKGKTQNGIQFTVVSRFRDIFGTIEMTRVTPTGFP
jgi:flagellar hook-associated protein FlgK